MMKITDDSKATFIQKSRIWPCVSDFYPEMCARFCLTPYDGEPGFYDFRSVSAEDVIIRTDNSTEPVCANTFAPNAAIPSVASYI